MSYDLEEQDQLALVREFWERWGNVVSSLLLAVAAAWAAWGGWQWWQGRQVMQAASLYAQLDGRVAADELKDADAIWARLRDSDGHGAYAQMGALRIARAHAAKGDVAPAESALHWAADHAQSTSYRAVAMLDLSALQADAKQVNQALATVASAPAPEFDGLFAARRGDLHALMGQRSQARDDYRKALVLLPPDSSYRGLLQRKLESVGGQA